MFGLRLNSLKISILKYLPAFDRQMLASSVATENLS